MKRNALASLHFLGSQGRCDIMAPCAKRTNSDWLDAYRFEFFICIVISFSYASIHTTEKHNSFRRTTFAFQPNIKIITCV